MYKQSNVNYAVINDSTERSNVSIDIPWRSVGLNSPVRPSPPCDLNMSKNDALITRDVRGQFTYAIYIRICLIIMHT